MGKKGGSSWLTAVKRAFRSPSKDPERKSKSRQREEAAEQEEEEKKREKRSRWLFRSRNTSSPQQVQKKQPPVPVASTSTSTLSQAPPATDDDEVRRRAFAEAAAVAKAIRLKDPTKPYSNFVRENCAALAIQTSFRGYLARRAFRALKGLVKLQAVVRGHNVRKQANMTLRCMQALVRVQERMRDKRVRLSQEGAVDGSSTVFVSSFSCDTTTFCHFEEPPQSRDGSSSVANDRDGHSRSLEELKVLVRSRNAAAAAAALKRERALAHAFSHQIWKPERNASSSLTSFGEEEEEYCGAEELQRPRPKSSERWTASRSSWEQRSEYQNPTNHQNSRGRRASTDHREPIKTLEIDTARPFSYTTTPSSRRPPTPVSPRHRSPSSVRPLQILPVSPRSYALHSQSYYHNRAAGHLTVPNYMAATESAKARLRSQSAPRQRPSMPERDRGACCSAKKRLSFPVPPDPYTRGGSMAVGYDLRSPSFKSANGGRFGLEQRSNVSSSCTDSFAGEISPSSTTDLCRWLR